MDNIQRIINEQVLSWANRESRFRQKKEDPGTWPVITISREFGAGGKPLAKAVSVRTGFKVWDKEVLTAIAEASGADEQFLASLDERRRNLIDNAMYSTFMGYKQSNTNYFRSLVRIIQTIGAHGKSIIVGRGSNYILGTQSALRVRLVCPLKKRITNISGRLGITEKDAEKMIRTRDSERTDFISYYFKRNPASPEDYDVVLNSDKFSVKQLAELLLHFYETKFDKKIPRVSKV